VSQYLTRGLRSAPLPGYFASPESFKTHIEGVLNFLVTARPTAVNLSAATRRLTKSLNDGLDASKDLSAIAQDLITEGKAVADEDVGRNKLMAKWGGSWLVERVAGLGEATEGTINVLTVCNTGSLATSVCDFIFWLLHQRSCL